MSDTSDGTSADDELSVQRFEDDHRGRFVLTNRAGDELGEMTYSRATDALVIVDHTEVDPILEGRGAGRLLFETMVAWARETHTEVTATCPFALAMFDRDPSSRDVLAR